MTGSAMLFKRLTGQHVALRWVQAEMLACSIPGVTLPIRAYRIKKEGEVLIMHEFFEETGMTIIVIILMLGLIAAFAALKLLV